MPSKKRKQAPKGGRRKKLKSRAIDEAEVTPTQISAHSPSSPISVPHSKSIEDLSPELLMQIVELVQDDDIADDRAWDASTLSALCLTSKTFNVIATPTLYQTVDLRFRRIASVRPLLRTLSLKRALGNNVKRLCIPTSPGPHGNNLDRHEKLEISEIAKLLGDHGYEAAQSPGWNAEIATLLLILPHVRYLGVCVAQLQDLLCHPSDMPSALRVMRFATIHHSYARNQGTLTHLREVRVYPHHQLVAERFRDPWLFTRNIDVVWSSLAALTPPTVRSLSIDRIRELRRLPFKKESNLSFFSSLTLTRAMISETTLSSLLEKCHRLEHIYIRWDDFRALSQEEVIVDGIYYPLHGDSIGLEQGLVKHTASLRTLVLDLTGLMSKLSLSTTNFKRYKAHFSSLRDFSKLETLELSERHLLDRPIRSSYRVRLEDYLRGLASMCHDFFPPSLKRFTLYSELEHWEAYNVLALLVDFLPEGLEHVCVMFRVHRPKSHAQVERYNQQVARRSDLSEPPKIQLQHHAPISYHGRSLLRVEYHGPNMSTKLATFKTEWRKKALQIHRKQHRNDDLPW